MTLSCVFNRFILYYNSSNKGGIVMALTDDEFVKNGKLEGYIDIMNQLHEQQDQLPEMNYEFNDIDDEDDED